MRATWTMCFGACAAACLVATAMACDQGAGVTGVTVSGTAVPATDDAGAGQGLRWGPTGVSVPVAITSTGAPGGYVVALSAQPSNITVSPASVTLGDDGKATAYALVPYGTSGYVILSAPGASTGSVPVRGSPLVLCDPTASVATGSELGSAGQVYTVSAQALIEGSCDDQGKPLAGAIEAPPGVTLTFTLQQPTAGGSTSGSGGAGGSSGASGGDAGAAASGTSGGGAGASSTDETGLATTNILVPWGPDALLQVTGTGAIASQAIHGIGNPVSVGCMYWSMQSSGVYAIRVQAVAGNQVVPGATISVSDVYPPASGNVAPGSVLTNDAGLGTAFLTVPDAGSLPVTVEAVVGSTAQVVQIGTAMNGDAGTCL